MHIHLFLLQYDELYKRSISDPDGFWGEVAAQFHWEKKVSVGLAAIDDQSLIGHQFMFNKCSIVCCQGWGKSTALFWMLHVTYMLFCCLSVRHIT